MYSVAFGCIWLQPRTNTLYTRSTVAVSVVLVMSRQNDLLAQEFVDGL